MSSNLRWRILITLAAIGLAAFTLWPTYRFYTLSDDQIANMDPVVLEDMQARSLRLGLDLQGGMHMILEIDDSELEDMNASDVMDRALEVIRNRIDEFGVTEPLVQKAGEKRIIVELAGIDDFERGKEIISRAAVLEFKMVRTGAEMRRLVERLDLELVKLAGSPSVDTTSSTPGLDPVFGDTDPGTSPDEEALTVTPTEGTGDTGDGFDGIDLAQYLAADVPAWHSSAASQPSHQGKAPPEG